MDRQSKGETLEAVNVLVLNCGSATVKFQIVATDLDLIQANADQRLARGTIERLGGEAIINTSIGNSSPAKTVAPLRDLRAAVEHIVRWALASEVVREIHAVGHRVVHGGERFTASALITPEVRAGIEACIDLAPLHNPNNLSGIAAAAAVLGASLPQVAVFDTAFHQSLPDHAFLYALPYQLYRRHGIRRYGFHGTSHRYVAYRYRLMRDIPRDKVKIVTLHLGNGCSAAAINAGVSVDTSMGLTPLEGLVMGTRSGDLDPAVLDLIAAKEGWSLSQVESLLNSQSGLLGISGLTSDMRDLLAEIEEHEDRRAKLAVEMFCYRARKYIGAYLAALGGADAVVFTGGIGENSAQVRRRICQGLEWAGLTLDEVSNQAAVGVEARISPADARLAAYVIPTDEELLIARDTARAVLGVIHD